MRKSTDGGITFDGTINLSTNGDSIQPTNSVYRKNSLLGLQLSVFQALGDLNT
ncbi:MAG TPA: hypothetical protein VE130_00440 [Nitrososphaeraceae archaeon]|nr:hypothetical protein [Nitrososphaeraceae archaeon]